MAGWRSHHLRGAWHYRRQRETLVPCPRCAAGALVVRISCHSSSAGCPACHAHFGIGELMRQLDDERAQQLAEVLDSRPSDRV